MARNLPENGKPCPCVCDTGAYLVREEWSLYPQLPETLNPDLVKAKKTQKKHLVEMLIPKP